uniref:Uncharacterized protein n=1 Tax=Anguilla anguilla TaxID=7936 RepID=A0A0E9PNY2_ANGAN
MEFTLGNYSYEPVSGICWPGLIDLYQGATTLVLLTCITDLLPWSCRFAMSPGLHFHPKFRLKKSDEVSYSNCMINCSH